MKPLLIIYDDEKRHAERYEKKLKKLKIVDKKYEIRTVDDDQFVKMIAELKKRRIFSRKKNSESEWKENDIDLTTIFLIDFDLINSCEKIPENGEEISYYIRFYSKCKYIIQLNRYGYKTFDLTLNGHLDSYADINIGNEDLDNKGLWDSPYEEYRPWYWPCILSYVKNYDDRTKFIKEKLNEPIIDCFNFEMPDFYSMSQVAIEQLGTDIESMKKFTLNDFFLKSKITLQEKDKHAKFSDDMKSRIIASRFSKWIERSILPGQNILIDAPHLVQRYPSLLTKNLDELKNWNELCDLTKGYQIPINNKKLDSYKFDDCIFSSRPCWLWGKVSDDPKINEVSKLWERPDINFCFTEDESKFYPVKECREFNSNVDSHFKRRYIRQRSKNNVEYRPALRLY